jgi:hypothetical protein
LENFSLRLALRLAKARDSALEEMKKVNNRTAQGKPPSPKISPPLIAAATAPLRLSVLSRQAAKAITTPRIRPMKSCVVII